MMRLLLAVGVCCLVAVAQDSTDSILGGLNDLLKTNSDDLNGDSPHNQHRAENQPYNSAPGGGYQHHPDSSQYGPHQQGYNPESGNNRYPQNRPQNTRPTHEGDEQNPNGIHDARDILANDNLLAPIGGIDQSIDNAGHKNPQHQVPSRYGQQGLGRQYTSRRVQPFHSRYTPNEPIPDKASYVHQSPNSVPRFQAVPNHPEHPSGLVNSYAKPYQQHQPSARSGQQYNGNTPNQGPVYISDQKPRYGNNARSHPNPPPPPVPAFGVPPTRPQHFVSPHQNQRPINNNGHEHSPYDQGNPTQQPYSGPIQNNQQQLYPAAGNRDQRYPANNQREQLPNYQGRNQGQAKPVYQQYTNPKRSHPAGLHTPVYPDAQGQNGINQYSNPSQSSQRNQYNQPPHYQNLPHQNQVNQYNQPPKPQQPIPHNQANQHGRAYQPTQPRYPESSVKSAKPPVQYTGLNSHPDNSPQQTHGYGQVNPVQQHPSNLYQPSHQQPETVYSPNAAQTNDDPAKHASQAPSDNVYPPLKPSRHEQDQYNRPSSRDGYSQPIISEPHNNDIDPYQAKHKSDSQSGGQYPGTDAIVSDHGPDHSSSSSVYKPSGHQDTAPSYDQSGHGAYLNNPPADKQADHKTEGTYSDDIYPRAYPNTEHRQGSSAESDPNHSHSGNSHGNHISHSGNADSPDLYPAKKTHDEADDSYPPVDSSGVYPPGNSYKREDIAKPSHISLAKPTAGSHDYSDIYPDTTGHKEPSVDTHGTNSGKGTHADAKDDLYPTSTNNGIEHTDPYTTKVSEATHDPYPGSSQSNDKDAISYLEPETPKNNDHLASNIHSHSQHQYPGIYPDTHGLDGKTDSYPPKVAKPHTEAYKSPQASGLNIGTHSQTQHAKKEAPEHPQNDDIYPKSKASADDIYPQVKSTKSRDGLYPKPSNSAYPPVHQTPVVHAPSQHISHHNKFPRNRYPQAAHSKFPQNQYPHAEAPKPVVHVTQPDPHPLPKPNPRVSHVVPQAIKNAATKPVGIIRDLNPTPTFIPPGLQGQCYKYKDLSAAYKLSDHSFGYPEDAITEELKGEPFLAPVLGFKNFVQPRKTQDIFGLGGNSQPSTNNDHLIARNIYPTGYKEGDFETPVPRDVSCRTSTHSLRMFKLDGGHCWTVNPDHNKVTFKHCSAPGDYCSNCGSGRSGGGSRGRCSEEYEWVKVWSFCTNSPPGQRVRPRRLYIPTGCSCKTYYC